MRHQRRVVSFVLAGLLIVGLAVAGAEVVRSQTADTVKAPIHDPDLDLPFAEREAKYRADWDAFTRRLAAWMASVDPASLDVRSLEHAESMVMTDDSKPTLDEAVASADRIVIGRVKELHTTKTNMFGTDVTIEVERTLKGKNEPSITVTQSSTFYPTSDWKGVLIVDTPGAPLMLPGDRYLLFLQDSRNSRLAIQYFSGYYEVEGGTVHALDENAFKGEVDGLLESGFLAKVGNAVRLSGGQ